MAKNAKPNTNNGANLGFEKELWAAANKMRGSLEPAEYKHVALGLIFLKYISDAFEAQRERIKKQGEDPEDRDYYTADNIFWVPQEARWKQVQSSAKLPSIGKVVDDAMDAIEKHNPSLKGVLPKDYNRPAIDKVRLGELIDLISGIDLTEGSNRSRDILGRVYEYFLREFASQEGKRGGEFYTPRSIVRLLVEMIEPYQGRVYDPCCGSSGMFVQSEEFIEAHGGRIGDISIYGQESISATWRLAKMNLAIRGIEANLGPYNADSFHDDLHKDLKADFILANPPFNQKDWGGNRLNSDVRWKYGIPPTGNANFAWVQHFIHHLSPRGVAGFVLANGSMTANQSGEGEIRSRIVEDDLVDCMISLPVQLFYGTQIPACLWFLARNKNAKGFRDRRGETLFIDARCMGSLVDRTHRELSNEEIQRISSTYHKWRNNEPEQYQDVPGFCHSVTTEELREHGHLLTPGRYVGFAQADRKTIAPSEILEKLKLLEERAEQVNSHANVLIRMLKEVLNG